MKILMTLTIILSTQVALAAVLLIPAPHVNKQTYFDWCYRENYSCTTDMFVNEIKNRPAQQFNQLIDQLDLNSLHFIELFKNSIINIIKNEDLDLTQLDMLIDLLKELNATRPSLLFKMIENELLRTRDVVLSTDSFDKSEFVLIFKKPISLQAAKKIKTSILKIPLYLISFANIPVKSDTTSYNRIVHKPLITGTCGQYKLNMTLEHSNWLLLKTEQCSQKNKEQKTTQERITREVHY